MPDSMSKSNGTVEKILVSSIFCSQKVPSQHPHPFYILSVDLQLIIPDRFMCRQPDHTTTSTLSPIDGHEGMIQTLALEMRYVQAQ